MPDLIPEHGQREKLLSHQSCDNKQNNVVNFTGNTSPYGKHAHAWFDTCYLLSNKPVLHVQHFHIWTVVDIASNAFPKEMTCIMCIQVVCTGYFQMGFRRTEFEILGVKKLTSELVAEPDTSLYITKWKNMSALNKIRYVKWSNMNTDTMW